MDHGQKSTPMRPKPISESLEKDSQPENTNVSNLEKTTKIISLKESSSTNTSIGLWHNQSISLEQNSSKNSSHSSLKKVPQSSYQVFLWETAVTVGLLMMALWMQGLPTREIPQIIENNGWPPVEISRP